MDNKENILFEELKKEVQTAYTSKFSPTTEDISRWKGIDIIYFQEDLRKVAKGSISEKSFYTYFKSSNINKLPRIDLLNILSIYVGYESWHDYKSQKNFIEESVSSDFDNNYSNKSIYTESQKQLNKSNEIDLQINTTEKQKVEKSEEDKTTTKINKKYLYITIIALIITSISFLAYSKFYNKTYKYCFIDLDRNSPVQNTLEIKIYKEDESPIFYRIKPGECFYYSTKDKNINMVISSPLHENKKITRNLDDAPIEETIELKPDDYKMAVDYFSKKSITGNAEQSSSLIKQKRSELEKRISDKAVIYQVYDSDLYGIETLDKQKYITLVTTPTTSLKNLQVIEMKTDGGKITSIKFKINDDENL